ncbi:hypothetical protein SAMN05421504_103774 [Amycolatopsis xylanica]|uniref:DUF6542 domain-containing protein n=1 Tax=Amycolatopsis xylanica TaxID=589385 RepID=A0A1H3EE56_9PSEU|nr:DUF6542 domain-containing protein [Amycolatopsis xylanica]SDX76915.1 hypothetical protein SAMN05421504_103774 [Amycolatopsis xylanica]
MTAIRDRQSDPDADDIPVPWDERPIISDRRGLPWWGAVLVGFGMAVLGAFIDQKLQGHLTLLFQACYCLGAVAAVCAVQRRGLFGPMVQPPLVLAVTVPGVVLLAADLSQDTDMLSKALKIGRPLIDGFPTMAITTGVTLAIGIFRIFRERDPDAGVKVKKGTKPAKRDDDEERPARNTAASRVPAGAAKTPERRPRRPASETGSAPVRRPRPADDAAPRRRTPREEPRQRPRAPRDGDEPPRRREPRGDTPPPRRRTPRAEPPRGDNPPRRAPRREPPQRRPWDED